jgi:hypothetical protein
VESTADDTINLPITDDRDLMVSVRRFGAHLGIHEAARRGMDPSCYLEFQIAWDGILLGQGDNAQQTFTSPLMRPSVGELIIGCFHLKVPAIHRQVLLNIGACLVRLTTERFHSKAMSLTVPIDGCVKKTFVESHRKFGRVDPHALEITATDPSMKATITVHQAKADSAATHTHTIEPKGTYIYLFML